MWDGAWPSLTIMNYRRTLDGVRAMVESPFPDQPDEITRALSRFLVVRACGYLEVVADECCASYARSKSSSRVADYSRSWLGRGRNPSPGSLIDLVRRFGQDWAEELAEVLTKDDEYMKRELSSLVDRRNKIAHGAGEGITASKALALTKVAEEIADWFVARLDPR